MEFQTKGAVIKVDEAKRQLLKATANETEDGVKHRQALAQVMSDAWRAGVLEPDLLGTIFSRIDLEGGIDAKFPLDFYSPGLEGAYKAFVVPAQGQIPDKVIVGDEIRVPTYKVANAISWGLDYARDARWDVISRAIDVFTNGFTQKLNDDGWHVILKAASESSASVISDSAAASGAFTKSLLLNLMVGIKRQTGGRNAKVTDVYLSPEAINDIRNFTDSVVDQTTLRDLITSGEDSIPTLFGVRLHEPQELGYAQEYQNYLLNTIGASVAASDEEFVVALDQRNRDSFVMPIRQNMEMFDDKFLHRSGKQGVYGWLELGFAALDTRRAVLGSL
jgi:hypothetical protein